MRAEARKMGLRNIENVDVGIDPELGVTFTVDDFEVTVAIRKGRLEVSGGSYCIVVQPIAGNVVVILPAPR